MCLGVHTSLSVGLSLLKNPTLLVGAVRSAPDDGFGVRSDVAERDLKFAMVLSTLLVTAKNSDRLRLSRLDNEWRKAHDF